jgi:hyaluronan synthase
MLSKIVSGRIDKLLIITIALGLGVMFYFLVYKEIYQLFLNVAYTKYTNYEINYKINEISGIVLPGLVFVSLALILLSFRTVLFFLYRESTPADSSNAPILTVIIPAYNEGMMVERTINSVILANYPHDRLEIFVVDDGSSDDTWEYISQAARCHPDLVTPIGFLRTKVSVLL